MRSRPYGFRLLPALLLLLGCVGHVAAQSRDVSASATGSVVLTAPSDGASIDPRWVHVEARASVIVGRPVASELVVNGSDRLTMSSSMLPSGDYVLEGTYDLSGMGRGKLQIAVVVEVEKAGRVRETLSSRSHELRIEYDGWYCLGGDPSRSYSFYHPEAIETVELSWYLPVDGEVRVSPLVTGRSVLLCSQVVDDEDAPAERVSLPVVSARSIDTGAELWRLEGYDLGLSGGRGTIVDAVVIPSTDFAVLFVTNTGRRAAFVGVDVRRGEAVMIVDDVPLSGQVSLLPVWGEDFRAGAIAFGVADDGAESQVLYSFTLEGRVSFLAATGGVPGIDPDAVANRRYLLTQLVLPTTATAYAVVREHGPVLFEERTDDFAVHRVEMSTAVPSDFSSYITFGFTDGRPLAYFGYENRYFELDLGSDRLRPVELPEVRNVSTSRFAVFGGTLYHFAQERRRHLLEGIDVTTTARTAAGLSRESDYARRFFIQAFSIPPIVSTDGAFAVDRNYTVYWVPFDSSGNPSRILSIPAPEEIREAKEADGNLPFGIDWNEELERYYNQPAPAYAHRRLIVATGEGEPNWLMCYRIDR